MLSAGTGPVFMIRWYWKRVNAASEISAMCASLIFSLIAANWNLAQEIRLCLVAALTTLVWITVTLVTKPASEEKLAAFYAQVRPGHWRWRELLVFLCGVVLVYAAFFAIGELLRARYLPALINLLVAAVAGLAAAIALLRRQPIT